MLHNPIVNINSISQPNKIINLTVKQGQTKSYVTYNDDDSPSTFTPLTLANKSLIISAAYAAQWFTT